LAQNIDSNQSKSASSSDLEIVETTDGLDYGLCSLFQMNESRRGYELLLRDQIIMSSIDKWLIFSLLKPSFFSSIRIACVFGCSGNEALIGMSRSLRTISSYHLIALTLIVTKDDEVFALGSNCSSCLGLGETAGSLEPRRVEALTKKGIEKFAYGSGPHVIALNQSGEIFTWGHNGYHQVF
jgi:hypothetical protein